MFIHVEEAIAWIEHSHRFGEKLDLSRMNLACEYLDHPELSFPSIHIAGTNGKGSTANYIKNILKEAGYRCGIYTSPYVVSFNERIGIDDIYISDEDILHYANILNELWNKVYEEHHDSITFFEILTLMMFLYFRDQKVDIAVIEVGLGGLLDATNVIVPICSVITNISFDHMKQLGNTLESIALNKLGIVKPNNALITTVEQDELISLFADYCKKKNAYLYFAPVDEATDFVFEEHTKFSYKGNKYELSLAGIHQVKNAILAIEAIQYVNQHTDFHINTSHIQKGLFSTKWPGRLEIFDHRIVLDGAHNIGGASSLEKSMKKIFPNRRIICLFCMMKDKEHQKVIAEFDQFVSEFHFTEIEYARRADAIELFHESSHPFKYIHLDYKEAMNQLVFRNHEDILLITGSLYFISEARKYLIELLNKEKH